MDSADYWNVFLETGAPEAYLLFSAARKTEGNHVSDDSGNRTSRNRLQ